MATNKAQITAGVRPGDAQDTSPTNNSVYITAGVAAKDIAGGGGIIITPYYYNQLLAGK